MKIIPRNQNIYGPLEMVDMLFIPKLAHKLIPQSLLTRFILIIIIPTLIGQILTIFLFYDRHWYNVSNYTSGIIANEIRSLLEKDKDNIETHTLVQEYLNLTYQFNKDAKLPLTQPKISEELEIFKNILDSRIHEKNIVKMDEKGKINAYFQLEEGVLDVSFQAKLLINPTTYIFVLWLICLTILLLTVSLIFSKNQIKSILSLAEAADQFGRGAKITHYFKPSGALEIKKTGIAFLRMKDRIEKQIAKRTRMLAMISHDLCTPLTRMKLQLELMEKTEATEELQEDITIMQHMVKSYLDFTKGESNEQYQLINLSNWIVALTKKWSSIDIELDVKKYILAKIQPINFERAISNLISNAVKYASKIKISMHSTGNNVVIKIEDNGKGIEDEEKLLVFKPFYRTDKSRSLSNYGNVGLGLAITKEIILDHKGTISLQDSKSLGGLLVRITIPSNINNLYS